MGFIGSRGRAAGAALPVFVQIMDAVSGRADASKNSHWERSERR
jgi:hypothetical protein